LGGFFVDGTKGILAKTYFKPGSASTANSVAFSGIVIEGEFSQV
jgi:hypothetical protein